jgi:hypothetical protein
VPSVDLLATSLALALIHTFSVKLVSNWPITTRATPACCIC